MTIPIAASCYGLDQLPLSLATVRDELLTPRRPFAVVPSSRVAGAMVAAPISASVNIYPDIHIQVSAIYVERGGELCHSLFFSIYSCASQHGVQQSRDLQDPQVSATIPNNSS